MRHNILNDQLQIFRTKIDDLIRKLQDMTIAIGNEDLSKTVSDLRTRITEPFMFVIVGEVKVGKSSFINALLETDKEICKVAPDPCTDTIQQILFGNEEKTLVVSEHLKKLYYPVEILKEIAIVDTPGTNTISEYHQEITEGFVPGSDLIVFVFEAKNPYRQSAWDFFDFIHADWRKKIIFVLQQADLMNAEDLAVNENGVMNYALKKGVNDPRIFSVSAKLELEGKTAESGFLPVREYIKHNITGGKAPILKLSNNIDTSLNIGEKIRKGLDVRSAQLKADLAFREDISQTLKNQETRSRNQVDILVENLVAGYERITRKTEKDLASGLSFMTLAKRSFLSLFSKRESLEDWLKDLSKRLETDLNNVMRDKLNDGVLDIAESIQQMAKIIDLKIRNSQTILKDNHAIFGDIADKRSNVLRDLQSQFSNFINRTESFVDQELIPDGSNLSPNLATGSGLAVIGVIVATITQGMVFDITGGIITTIGLLFAGVTVRLKRKQIIQGYRSEIENGKERLSTELDEKLKAYISKIKSKIDQNFDNFDAMLSSEEEQVNTLEEQLSNIREELNTMSNELETYKVS
ncbi:MAG: dynamin family protein [Bacteroidota bacterium]